MSFRILTTAAAAVAAMVISITAASAGCCACGCGYQSTYQQTYYPAPVYAPTPAYRVDLGPSHAVPAETTDEPVPEYGYRRAYPYMTYPNRHRVGYRHYEDREYYRSPRVYGPRPWHTRDHGLRTRPFGPRFSRELRFGVDRPARFGGSHMRGVDRPGPFHHYQP